MTSDQGTGKADPAAGVGRRPGFLGITGPTASGKSALSVRVAERLGGEIISMDSRQVYRHLDIGTDKIPASDRLSVPHHGLDLLDPTEGYSAGRFARQARTWIREIRDREHVPLVVGGTGFFLRALIDPIFREPTLDPERVRALRDLLSGWELEELRRWVRALDPVRAPIATEGGPQRMMRTLEVALLSGRPLSTWHRTAGPEAEGLRGTLFLLELPREELYRRINARVERMMDRGLVAEVRALAEAGYGPDDPGMSGTGYRETLLYVQGEIDLDEAIDRIQRATRRYARRQITWFRHQLPETVHRLDALAPQEELVERVVQRWNDSP